VRQQARCRCPVLQLDWPRWSSTTEAYVDEPSCAGATVVDEQDHVVDRAPFVPDLRVVLTPQKIWPSPDFRYTKAQRAQEGGEEAVQGEAEAPLVAQNDALKVAHAELHALASTERYGRIVPPVWDMQGGRVVRDVKLVLEDKRLQSVETGRSQGSAFEADPSQIDPRVRLAEYGHFAGRAIVAGHGRSRGSPSIFIQCLRLAEVHSATTDKVLCSRSLRQDKIPESAVSFARWSSSRRDSKRESALRATAFAIQGVPGAATIPSSAPTRLNSRDGMVVALGDTSCK
jgi:hypothetical protein